MTNVIVQLADVIKVYVAEVHEFRRYRDRNQFRSWEFADSRVNEQSFYLRALLLSNELRKYIIEQGLLLIPDAGRL